MKRATLLISTVLILFSLMSCACTALGDSLDAFPNSYVETKSDALLEEDVLGTWYVTYMTFTGDSFDQLSGETILFSDIADYGYAYVSFEDDSTFRLYMEALQEGDNIIYGDWSIRGDEIRLESSLAPGMIPGRIEDATLILDFSEDKEYGWVLGASRGPNIPQTSTNSHTTYSEYLLPTDTEYIDYADLEGFTREEVVLIRNELYARHGYNFQDAEIRAYFNSQSWYEPIPGVDASTFDTAVFNGYERTNLETIVAYEREMGWRS